eukprot:scaffold148994_cov31-Tisochrysis_lutea.AAC.5
MVCLVWWCGNMFCLCGSLRKARVVARGYLKKGGLGWRALRLRSVAGHILVGRRGGLRREYEGRCEYGAVVDTVLIVGVSPESESSGISYFPALPDINLLFGQGALMIFYYTAASQAHLLRGFNAKDPSPSFDAMSTGGGVCDARTRPRPFLSLTTPSPSRLNV